MAQKTKRTAKPQARQSPAKDKNKRNKGYYLMSSVHEPPYENFIKDVPRDKIHVYYQRIPVDGESFHDWPFDIFVLKEGLPDALSKAIWGISKTRKTAEHDNRMWVYRSAVEEDEIQKHLLKKLSEKLHVNYDT